MNRDSAMSMVAGLLDRSAERVAELVADPRRFDRREIYRIADIWDNNTFPLFRVVGVRPLWLRERLARACLR